MLITNSTHQILEMCYPTQLAEDNNIRAKFTLDTKDGKGIALSCGGIFKGKSYIGSFAGFIGLEHNVTGDDKEAVDTLLENLSSELHEIYDIPLPPEDSGESTDEESAETIEEEQDNG